MFINNNKIFTKDGKEVKCGTTDSEGHYVCENCSNERKKSSNTST